MRRKEIMRCIILSLVFLVLGLAWAPNIMAQELSCTASNNVDVIPSPTTVHTGDLIQWGISITNKSHTNYDPPPPGGGSVNVATTLVADGGLAHHPPLELTMSVGNPGTFTALEKLADGFGDDDGICEPGERCDCTNLAAGMSRCEIKPGNPNIVLMYTTAGGVSFGAGQKKMIGTVHARATKPVTNPFNVAITSIAGFFDAVEALGVFHTNDVLCNPQIHSGAQGSTAEFFPSQPCIDVNKSVDSLLSKPGDSVLYTIELCNCGDVALNSITVADTKLGGDLVPPFPSTLAAGTVSDSTIFPNCVTQQINHVIPLNTVEDPYVNVVTATGIPAGKTQAISDVAQASVNLFQPAIDVTKTCDAVSKVGDTVNYTITLSNNSSPDTPALNCTAVDSLLGTVFGPNATLPLGDTIVNRQRVVQPGDPDPLVNTVTLTCSPQGFPNVLEASDTCQTNLVQPSCSISKTCSPDPLIVGSPITWQITLNNTGGIALNICVDDTVAQISTCELVQALGSTTLTSSRTVTAEDCPPESGTSANITNTAKATATVVGIGNKISCGEDSATCTCPQAELFGCRMTGGHPRFNPNGECVTDTLLLSDVKKIRSVWSSTNFLTVKEKIWYSVGGQIGAPDARCCNTPPNTPGRDEECPSGSWEHVHHEGTISWNSSTFSGRFAFHSGTASAPNDAYIRSIICADKGWCVQARCAPAKQIFWDGTGVFRNIAWGTHFPECRPIPVSNKRGATPTIHYYRAHVADFGEPAGCTDNQKPKGQCPWRSNGVGVVSEDGCSLDGSPVVIPWPLDEKFGDKGGQDCSGVCVNNRCGECPDWYEIEIHCTDDPDSPIIYKVGDFITHGNHQIHPEVGSSCFDTFPNP